MRIGPAVDFIRWLSAVVLDTYLGFGTVGRIAKNNLRADAPRSTANSTARAYADEALLAKDEGNTHHKN